VMGSFVQEFRPRRKTPGGPKAARRCRTFNGRLYVFDDLYACTNEAYP